MNQALLAKQAWRIYHEPEALWVRILRGIYFPATTILKVQKARNTSWTWGSLLYGRDLLLEHGQWAIGSEENVDIADHKWITSGEKLLGVPRGLKVSRLIDRQQQKWKVDSIQQLLPNTDIGKILQTPFSLTGAEDRFFGPLSPQAHIQLNHVIGQSSQQPLIPRIWPQALLIHHPSIGKPFGVLIYPRRSKPSFGEPPTMLLQ